MLYSNIYAMNGWKKCKMCGGVERERLLFQGVCPGCYWRSRGTKVRDRDRIVY